MPFSMNSDSSLRYIEICLQLLSSFHIFQCHDMQLPLLAMQVPVRRRYVRGIIVRNTSNR